MGGCPHSRIENEFNNKKNDLCVIWKKDLSHFLKMDLIRKGHI
jgi:sulfatase maturation enzyme AslB (radical SAM superfamily)